VRRPSYNRWRCHGSQACHYPDTKRQQQRESGTHEALPSIVMVDSVAVMKHNAIDDGSA